MKPIFPFLAAIICAFSPLFAQAPAIEWQNSIGGSGNDGLRALQQTSDGGYILGGFSGSNISGDKTEDSNGDLDYWVIKLDAAGIIQWQNTIGSLGEDIIYSLQQTTDGGYIIGGYSASNTSGDKTENSLGTYDYWVVKLNAMGAIQWQNTIGGNNYDWLRSIQQTAEGGYILGGSSFSNISGDKTENSNGDRDYWVVKLNATGDIQWQNTIGGNGSDELSSLHQTADGGYIIGGGSTSNISGDKTEHSLGSSDYWVIKLDAGGAIQWQNTIGGGEGDALSCLQQTLDGGYILAGHSASSISGDKTENSLGTYDYWVVKLNAIGAIQWQNTIGGNDYEAVFSIKQTADSGYILGGYSRSDISGDKTQNCWNYFDYWVIKLNSIGDIQWQKTIGGNGSDELYSLEQTTDRGYILGGHSASNISGDKTENSNGNYDYWVIKLAPETVPTEETFTTQTGITIYPNPTTDAIFIHTETTTTLCLHNTFGQIISTQIIQEDCKIDLSHYPNGIYFLVEMETGIGHKILKN